ncbi:MAG TPA: hypothetical protein VHY82_16600 [Acetobacteraceae bacterium]|nr:hypothetical protein [Acetobacteraceae bacterium]
MVKFYFNLQTDGAVSEDPEGTDLPDLEAARQEATNAAREMAAAAVRASNENPADCILIADASGRVLVTVSLADMIPKRLRKLGGLNI